MMKKFSLFSIALASITLMGCSSGELDEQTASQNQTPITFVSQVATRSSNVNLQKVQLVTGVQAGVFVKGTDGYITGGNNAQLTADGNGGFTGTTLYYPSDGSAVSVYAYAPYNSSWNEMSDVAADFTIAADQSTDDGYLASDLLCGAPVGTNSFTKESSVVAVNFQHKLAKLSIKFNVGEDIDMKGATVSVVNTLPSTTLKVIDGTLGVAKGTATAIKAVTFAADATTFQGSVVLVPQTVAAGNFIQVNLASGTSYYAKLTTDATFESGKAYVYNVNIGTAGASIVMSSTITDWDSNTTALSGNAEEAQVEPLTATFGTPGGNASYSAPTYTWTGSSNNLMPVFTFSNGELANYKTLTFTFSNLVNGPVRMGYYVGSSFTEFGNGFYSAGTKTVDLTALNVDLSTVTKIAFGGRSSSGSCDIIASDVVLK